MVPVTELEKEDTEAIEKSTEAEMDISVHFYIEVFVLKGAVKVFYLFLVLLKMDLA